MELSSLTKEFSTRTLSLIGLNLAVVAVMAALKPVEYLDWKNFEAVAIGLSYDLLVALGMTFVLLVGGIDLSVGSVLAVSGIVSTLAMQRLGLPVPLGMLLALLVAASAGLVSGLLVAKARMAPFVVTLGMMALCRGIAFVLTQGYFVHRLPPSFVALGRSEILGVPSLILFVAAVAAILSALTRHLLLFRRMELVGINSRAALLSGLPVAGTIVLAFVLSAVMAGVAAIAMTSRLAMGHAGFGQHMELRAIAAAVIGGASLHGGKGSIHGTVLGVILVALINNAFVMLNGSPNWQQAVSGVLLLVAIGIDVTNQRRREGAAVRQGMKRSGAVAS